jgi:DNA-binding PadR family transcriptional regulator
MTLLSKPEELLLMAVCHLRDQAYGVEILRYVSEKTGKEWSIGSVYVPLDRLARAGYVESYQGEPTQKRGGKRKRYFKITPAGVRRLRETKRLHDAMWSDIGPLLERS